MLGSNQKTICDVQPPLVNRSFIEINDWTSLPQSKGCIKYKGKYYVNLITGNTSTPPDGLLSGTYAVGSEDYCQVIKYFATNQTTCDMSSTFMKFFTGIGEYSQCAEGKVFECDEFIIFKNKGVYGLHQSLIDNNARHPHDREAWKNLGDFSNILNLIFDESEGYQITLPYWEECLGANCATLYKKCSLVVEKIDSGEVDNCGNPVFNELIFESLIDKNTDRPSLGSVKTDPTWRGPYTDSEFMNRQIGWTVNNDVIKSGTDIQLVTSMDFCDRFEWINVISDQCEGDCDPVIVKRLCPKSIGTDENGTVINNGTDSHLISYDAPHNGLTWVDVPTEECTTDCDNVTEKRLQVKACDDSIIVDECGVKVGQIGIDRNGNPVMAGACLVTCDTDLHATAISDQGTQTVITLSDGTTVSGPRIDADDFVVSFANVVNPDGSITVTITMDSGTVLTHTLPAPDTTSELDCTLKSWGMLDPQTFIYNIDLMDNSTDTDWQTQTFTLADLGAESHAEAVTLWVYMLAAIHQDEMREDERVRSWFRVGNQVAQANAGSDAQITQDNPDDRNNFQITIPVVNGSVSFETRHSTNIQLPAGTIYPAPTTGTTDVRSLIQVSGVEWKSSGPACPN